MRTSDRLRHALAVALLALAGAATALPAGVPWTTLPAADRERLTARAARLQAMSPAERAAFAARVAAWHALPAQERERRRIAFAAIEAMPHPERAVEAIQGGTDGQALFRSLAGVMAQA